MENLIESKQDLKVWILKSNIRTEADVAKVAKSFKQKPILKWSIDLHDWEKVLKIQTRSEVKFERVMSWVRTLGFKCAELNH
ncbi:MAG: hypothetical protein AAFY41_17215 [Bacteroidota bacterium]